MTRPVRLLPAAFITALVLICSPAAFSWGCKGHQAVALIAEGRLTPHARAAALKILEAAPIDPSLRRYCNPAGLDPFADSSTWADDDRIPRPETGDWHFIDIPRGAPDKNLAQYCPPDTSCVTAAIAAQLAALRQPNATPQQRGDALRFLIHLVGDIHQPLHATNNNDRGGNCVPVAFFDRLPRETNEQEKSYSPNLHAVWDSELIERFEASDSLQIAADLSKRFKAEIPAWQAQRPKFLAWAWESHELAENFSYDKLPYPIQVEKPVPVMTCADDDHVSTRMLHLGEMLGDDYSLAALPVINQQIAKAGARLAGLLNSLWP